MSDEKQKRDIVVLGRLSFPVLHEPEPDDKGVPKYSTAVILDEGEEKKLLPVIKDAVRRAWGEEAVKRLGKGIKPGLREQIEKDLDGYGDEGYFLNARTKYAPKVVWPDRTPVMDPTETYAGRNAAVAVTVFTYDHPKSGKGVSFGLTAVMVLKGGEPLAGGADTTELFADYEDLNFTREGADTSTGDDQSADLFGDEL